ncbi:MAG: methyltransferase domain-containing protein [Pseudomonadota bacterium]
MTKPDLEGAYDLKTPEESLKLYSDWAETYDESFAEASGYQLPVAVAEAYARSGGTAPVLDIGAGTGLVGAALTELGIDVVDGTDISQQMLAEAALKDCYENLFEGDVTERLDVDDGTYHGIVSAGTFTHGHVGPEAIDELLRIASADALFVLSINAEHFAARGFEAKLNELRSRIKGLTKHEIPIYDDSCQDGFADDKAFLVIFRKA